MWYLQKVADIGNNIDLEKCLTFYTALSGMDKFVDENSNK